MNRVGAALAATALLTTAASASDEPVDSPRWPSEYNEHFQKYTKRYFGPYFDWRWFKSQAITESTLKPGVRSPAGAVGLMQILPSTFAEIQRANPYFTDIVSPRWNIAAGIWYDRYLYRHKAWVSLGDDEQLLLAFAGYNAGLGGALRAYKATPHPADSWQRIAPQAPRETQGYVRRIISIKTGAPPPKGPGDRGIARQIARHVAGN